MEHENQTKTKVCKQFFLRTLHIGQRLIDYTLKECSLGFAKQDAKGPQSSTKCD